jgi:heat shock protein 1/8
MRVLIKRNTTIPAKQTQTFSTHLDNQTNFDIKVFEGERSMAKDNHLLGEFQLVGIPPAPSGVPKIEVTFDIDGNGLLNVSAIDKSSGKENKITTTNDKERLSRNEIERMINDAEEYRKEDEIRSHCVSAQNSLESYCFNIKERIKVLKINDDDKKKINDIIEDTLTQLAKNRVRIFLFLFLFN